MQQKLLNVLPCKELEEEWKIKIKSNRFSSKEKKMKSDRAKNVTVLLLLSTTTTYIENVPLKNCKKQRSLCVLSWCQLILL